MIEWLLALTIAALAAAGLYLVLGRDLVGLVVGLLLVAAAGNLFVFGAGRIANRGAPLVAEGATALGPEVGNPLTQALVLTAIVIGFALSCFAFALVLRLRSLGAGPDGDGYQYAEPRPKADGEPADPEERR
ncbi:MAG: cation:proton antiporter [Planctomycetaceae bacterium]|nr:cation:proton antiporter [Planctomycetaceae bacterium]